MARPQRRGLAPRTSTKASSARVSWMISSGLIRARRISERFCEQTPGGCVVPGLLAFATPLTDQLAERLVEQQQGDAVFAAGIAGLFEDAHVAKAGDFIEQEENAS